MNSTSFRLIPGALALAATTLWAAQAAAEPNVVVKIGRAHV